MTTARTAETAPTPVPSTPRPEVSVMRRGIDLVTAEWIKLWSVRSTYLALLAAAVAPPFISIGVALSNVSYIQSGQPHGPDRIDAVASSFRGIAFAQLVLGILGALAITSEYGSGLIRTTFAATPQRGRVLAAKATVVTLVATVFGQLLAFGLFLGTQAVYSRIHAGLSIHTPGVVRATMGAGLYLSVVTMLGLGIGALVRHTAAAIATIVAVFFLLPQIPAALPSPWNDRIADLMPATAAQQISTFTPNPHLLTPGSAVLLLLTYAIAVPLLGALVVSRRDA